jgi:hypothetical protein
VKDVNTIRDDRNLILFDLNQDIMVFNIFLFNADFEDIKIFQKFVKKN